MHEHVKNTRRSLEHWYTYYWVCFLPVFICETNHSLFCTYALISSLTGKEALPIRWRQLKKKWHHQLFVLFLWLQMMALFVRHHPADNYMFMYHADPALSYPVDVSENKTKKDGNFTKEICMKKTSTKSIPRACWVQLWVHNFRASRSGDGKFYETQKRRTTYFEAQKLWKGRSGTCHASFRHTK